MRFLSGTRPRGLLRGLFSIVALTVVAAAPSRLAAQDTTKVARPDTLARPDTTAAQDTARAPADTIPPPQLPHFPERTAPGFGSGVWVYGHDALLQEPEITLLDLLERIPGITPVRGGFYAQPASASAFGGGGGRVEILLDGYALDPLGSSVNDLSRIELAEMDSVRIERRTDVIRVELHSATPATPQAYARVEAGVAEPGGRLFRGVFLAPHFLFGPFGGAVERFDVNRVGSSAFEGDETGGWAKWSFIRGTKGIQAELRHSTVNRDPDVPWAGKYDRTDWVVRARGKLGSAVTAEAYYGASSFDQPWLGPVPVPTDSTVVPDTVLSASTGQAGLRLGIARGPAWGEAALRLRTADFLPKTEAELSAGTRIGAIASVDGGLDLAGWSGRSVTSGHLRAQLSPVPGITVFGELGGGTRGALLRDSVAGELFPDRTALRAGASFDRGRFHLGAAGVHVKEDSVAPFGLPFDRVRQYFPGATMNGVEAEGTIQLLGPLSVEGWYQGWNGGQLPIYTPDRSWRASLVFHASPLKTGHLEILARAEATSRGAMMVPNPTEGDSLALPIAAVPAVTTYGYYLQIRIMDFRIFIRGDDFLNNKPVFDIPGYPIPGPRIFYGIKWQFLD